VKTPAFRPGSKRRFTSLGMSVALASVFVCPDTGFSPRPPRRRCCGTTGLNREIMRSGWGLLVRRLQDKAPGRVEKIKHAFTSQRCSACGHVDARSRESQARFVCTVCGYADNADVNAARNIAAGHAVAARGGDGVARPVNREPHLLLQSA
jgi:putative transposase